MKDYKIGVAISVYNKGKFVATNLNVIEKVWKNVNPYIAVSCNDPDTKRNLERFKIDELVAGIDYEVRGKKDLRLRQYDTIKKSVSAAAKNSDYVIHWHADAFALDDSSILSLVDEMEEKGYLFAGRGFGSKHVSPKQPMGDVDDHFFILNSRHVRDSGLYSDDKDQIEYVRSLIQAGVSSEGILACLVLKVTDEEKCWLYSDMSECEVLPSNRTDDRYSDNVAHRTLPPVNFDKKRKFLHCDDYGHLERIFEEQEISNDLISHNLLKEVIKPWGKEIWYELNEKYCYKRLLINKGHRTSYQYHVEKLETNYVIEGEATVWLENAAGVVEKLQLKKDDFFTVLPGRKHRIIAKTDLILQEVSTPEVDDVVRLEDDSDRPSGRIESEHKS